MTRELAEAARRLAQADLHRVVAEGRAEIQAGLARKAERRVATPAAPKAEG